jgi:IS4 transposase
MNPVTQSNTEPQSIHAVELVRHIRDHHNDLLRGKTGRERLEFYRREAANLERELAAPQLQSGR